MEAIGFEGNGRTPRFEAFCEKIGSIALNENGETDAQLVPADMPHGARAAVFIPSDFLRKVITCGAQAYLSGKLTAHQPHIGDGDTCYHLIGASYASIY